MLLNHKIRNLVEILVLFLRTPKEVPINKPLEPLKEIERTGVPDRRLDGIALLQQQLDECGADVPAPSSNARRLHRLLVTRGRRHIASHTNAKLPLVVELSMLLVAGDCLSVSLAAGLMIDEISLLELVAIYSLHWARYFERTGNFDQPDRRKDNNQCSPSSTLYDIIMHKFFKFVSFTATPRELL